MIEKRAKENIRKAYNTIKIYRMILAPVEIDIKEGTDVINIPNIVFSEADKKNIKVKYNTLQIIELINKKLKDYIENRKVKKGFKIYVLNNGELEVLGDKLWMENIL